MAAGILAAMVHRCSLCATGTPHDAAIEAVIAQHANVIRSYGWTVVHVTADGYDLPLSYTVGLSRLFGGRPEVLVSGMDPEQAHALLNAMVSQMRHRPGVFAVASDVFVAQLGQRGRLIEVPPESALRVCPVAWHLYLTQAIGDDHRAGSPPASEVPPYLQLIVPDADGTYPWANGYSGTRQQLFGPGSFLAQGDLHYSAPL